MWAGLSAANNFNTVRSDPDNPAGMRANCSAMVFSFCFGPNGGGNNFAAICGGSSVAGEVGILVEGRRDTAIRGVGLVQQFRNTGILLANSTGSVVTSVTTSNNCLSGIFVNGGSENVLEGNVSVRNGNLSLPCGGI